MQKEANRSLLKQSTSKNVLLDLDFLSSFLNSEKEFNLHLMSHSYLITEAACSLTLVNRPAQCSFFQVAGWLAITEISLSAIPSELGVRETHFISRYILKIAHPFPLLFFL